MYNAQGERERAPSPVQRPCATAAAAAYLLAAAGLILVGVFYAPLERGVRALFPGMGDHGVLLLTQAAYYLPFMLLPALLLARRGPDAARLTGAPGLVGMLGVAALALCGLLLAQYVSVLWAMVLEALHVPVLESSIALPDNAADTMLMVIYYAALPGVCEELFFRGALLGAFERVGTRRAVALVAVLFTLLHGSIEGLPVQLFLGFMLGYLAYAFNSVYAPVVYHTVHNAAIVLINVYASGGGAAQEEQAQLAQSTFAYYGGWAGVVQLVVYAALLAWAMQGFLRVVGHGAQRRGAVCVPPRAQKLPAGAHALLAAGVVIMALVYFGNAIVAWQIAGGGM